MPEHVLALIVGDGSICDERCGHVCHLPHLVGSILPIFFWDNKMDSMPAFYRRPN